MYKYHFIITLAASLTLSTIAMELSSEQKQDAHNWYQAHKKQNDAWEVFDKTPAGLQCQEASALHKKNPSPETNLLIDKALKNALKTKEFNDFFQAKSLEIALRKKLIETDKSRERTLIGTQGYTTQTYRMEENYGTLPIHPEYSHSKKFDSIQCVDFTQFIDDESTINSVD